LRKTESCLPFSILIGRKPQHLFDEIFSDRVANALKVPQRLVTNVLAREERDQGGRHNVVHQSTRPSQGWVRLAQGEHWLELINHQML
jgi:hypothetical protein